MDKRQPAQAPHASATLRHEEATDFETWMSEVQHVLTFITEPDEWRRYYDAGLSPPPDAIAQHRADEDVS